MHLPFAATGIRFNDCFFTEPVRLTDWICPRFTGLFVVLTCDPDWAPRPFQPLCFGEFGNNSGDPIDRSGYGWLRNANGTKGLCIAMLPLPFSTSGQRAVLRNELIAAYNPVLQGQSATASAVDLAHRMDQLEKRYQEQSEQVLMMLGNIHRHFEPQPVPLRRRIGFLPEPA